MSEPRRALDLSVQEVIYAGLEALGAAIPLDLCAYLHLAGATGPQLFLGTPPLSSLDGARAFDIFCELRDVLDRPRWHVEASGTHADGTDVLSVSGFEVITVTTTGADSRGIHAFGRRGAEIEDPARLAAVRLAHALGVATHRLESAVTTALASAADAGS